MCELNRTPSVHDMTALHIVAWIHIYMKIIRCIWFNFPCTSPLNVKCVPQQNDVIYCIYVDKTPLHILMSYNKQKVVCLIGYVYIAVWGAIVCVFSLHPSSGAIMNVVFFLNGLSTYPSNWSTLDFSQWWLSPVF
jgi:hypothetical protein